VDLYFLDLDRHEWGMIHLIMGYILLGLLVLHVILHWKLIQSLFKRLIHKKNWQVPVILAFLFITILLLIFPFFISIKVQETAVGIHSHGHVSLQQVDRKSDLERSRDVDSIVHNEEHLEPTIDDIQVHGRMTLAQVAEEFDVPVSFILTGLQISDSVLSKTQLGHLRKQYGFYMNDVVHVIQQYKITIRGS